MEETKAALETLELEETKLTPEQERLYQEMVELLDFALTRPGGGKTLDEIQDEVVRERGGVTE